MLLCNPWAWQPRRFNRRGCETTSSEAAIRNTHLLGGRGMEPSVRKRIFINPVKWEESESQDCPNDRNMKPYIFMVYKEWQGIHCSFDLLSKSECKADRSKTIKMGGVKVKMLQMGGRLPRWSKCEEPKRQVGPKERDASARGNGRVGILKWRFRRWEEGFWRWEEGCGASSAARWTHGWC